MSATHAQPVWRLQVSGRTVCGRADLHGADLHGATHELRLGPRAVGWVAIKRKACASMCGADPLYARGLEPTHQRQSRG